MPCGVVAGMRKLSCVTCMLIVLLVGHIDAGTVMCALLLALLSVDSSRLRHAPEYALPHYLLCHFACH